MSLLHEFEEPWERSRPTRAVCKHGCGIHSRWGCDVFGYYNFVDDKRELLCHARVAARFEELESQLSDHEQTINELRGMLNI